MKKPKIFIVEDNRIVAEDLKHTLEDLGYEVSGIATTAEAALERIPRVKVDLALTDINLGRGMNGIELSHILWHDRGIPVVFLTAHADAKTLNTAKKSEPFGYIVKPFDEKEIQSTIEIALYKHRMDLKLKKNEKWLSTILKSIGDGVIATDEKGRITFLNPVAEQLTGWPLSEARGMAMEDVFNIVNEHTRQPCQNPVQKILDTGQIIGLGNHTLLIRRDGTELSIKDSGSPIVLDTGETIGAVLVFRDDTESKRAQKQLMLLEKAINQSTQTIAITDARGTIQYVNQAVESMTGYTCKEMIGNNFSILKGGERPAPFYEEMWQTLDNKKPWRGVFTNKKKDGTFYQDKAAIAPILDEYGQTTHYITVKRDITEELKKEKRLQQSQKMESIGTLAGGIAHDFNNILAPIIGFTQLSMVNAPKGSMLEDNLNEICQAGFRAKELVKQILTFARHSDQEKNPVLIHPIVKEALKFIRSSIPASIDIKSEISQVPQVLADPTQIHQIVMNLCTNAYQAMEPPTGTLAVTLKETMLDASDCRAFTGLLPGRYAMLEVSDTGPGISRQHLSLIFEPYFTTKDFGKGTGLGLAVVLGAVKNMDGDIQVINAPGKGAAFRVYLPTCQDGVDEKNTHGETKLPGGHGHILFVDDELSIVKMGKQILERVNYQVSVTLSSVEALSMFKKDPDTFDLVITDMTMPKMTGDELTRQLFKIRPDIPVIVCTGFSHQMSEQTAKAMGIKAYCIKPVSAQTLTRTVRNVLDKI